MAEAAPPTTLRDVAERYASIHPNAVVSAYAVVGAPAEHRSEPTTLPVRVEREAIIREFARVHAGCVRMTVIGERTLLMAGSHIGHDAMLGRDCEVAPNAVICGHVTIGDRVRIGAGATIKPGVRVGSDARIGMGAVVTKDVPAGETWVGNPARRMGPKWEPAS